MYALAILIGLLEGLTEFIPVSSTGHMIIAGHMLGFTGPRADAFEVFIQLGAILAVVGLYWRRFLSLIPGRHKSEGLGTLAGAPLPSGGMGLKGWHGLGLLMLTTAPALIAGKLAHVYIKEHLFSPFTVAIGLALGGIGLILVERYRPKPVKTNVDSLGWREALIIGFFQCLALWPGMSRAGSTIIGGMLMKIDRKTTAEYSFLAAVPIMFAATGYDLYKSRDFLVASDVPLFALGFMVSMVSAWFAIRYFIKFLANHTLQGFGWYRIALALFSWWYFGVR
jgi:undecaprenyl-diphosphatase